MIHLKIGKTKSKLATDWPEITVAQAITLSKVERPKGFDPDMEIEWSKEWVKFADGCFRALLDTDIKGGLNPLIVETYYRGLIHELVCDIARLYPQKYRIIGIESFKFGGKTYHLPTSLQIGDAIIPAYQETSETWVEASDLLRNITNTDFELLPALMATYCRPKGEEFTEKGQLERAEAFKGLTMDIGWEVFFSVIQFNNMLIKDFVSHVQDQVASLRRQLKYRGWPKWVTKVFYTGFQNQALPGL